MMSFLGRLRVAARPSRVGAATALSMAVGAGATVSTLSQLALNQKAELVAAGPPGTPLAFKFNGLADKRSSGSSNSNADGEISTHVICKLGKGSVDGAFVRVLYHPDLGASVLSSGWKLINEAKLSANGGIDDLVPPGTLKRGLYLIEYDFSGVDAAARRIYSKCPKSGNYNQLNPDGFFLAARSAITVKVEECVSRRLNPGPLLLACMTDILSSIFRWSSANSQNHLVLSVGDKELTVRPGVRAH